MDISSSRLHLAVRFSTVLFPFEEVRFLEALPSLGYVVTEKLPLLPVGARVSLRGQVAVKGSLGFMVDSERQILALGSLNAADVSLLLDEFGAIERLLLERFSFDSEANAHYYEFLAEITAAAENPLEVFRRLTRSLPDFGEVLGTPVANFGIRLAPMDGEPNSPNWFDIRLEPWVLRPTTHYHVVVVFRNVKRQPVFDFVGHVTSTVERLIMYIKRG